MKLTCTNCNKETDINLMSWFKILNGKASIRVCGSCFHLLNKMGGYISKENLK